MPCKIYSVDDAVFVIFSLVPPDSSSTVSQDSIRKVACN